MRTVRPLVSAFAVLMVMLSTPPAFAATCGNGADAVILSATSVSFGTYLPTSGTPAAANGTVTAACTWTFDVLPSFTITLSAGSAASYSPRHLSAGAAHINYNLYTNSAYTITWGTGSGGTSAQSYGASAQQSHTSFTTYGRIPASQLATAGSYSDSITVTMSY